MEYEAKKFLLKTKIISMIFKITEQQKNSY